MSCLSSNKSRHHAWTCLSLLHNLAFVVYLQAFQDPKNTEKLPFVSQLHDLAFVDFPQGPVVQRWVNANHRGLG